MPEPLRPGISTSSSSSAVKEIELLPIDPEVRVNDVDGVEKGTVNVDAVVVTEIDVGAGGGKIGSVDMLVGAVGAGVGGAAGRNPCDIASLR